MMRRCIALLIFCLLLTTAATAQVGQQPNFAQLQPGAGYTGPIDVNGTAYAFWSTRCGAAAYNGNILDIWDGSTGSTTETVLGCDGAGNIVVKSGSALATTCSVSCRVKTIYDQSGNTNCTTACDITQATNANRPTLNQTLLNSKIGLVFDGVANCLNVTVVNGGVQPTTASLVFNRTGNTTTLAAIYGNNVGGAQQIGNNSTTNTAYIFAGSAVQTATANDNTTHAMQALLNGASSAMYIDGTNTTTASPGTSGILAGTIGVGSQNTCGGNFFTGNWFETGLWTADKSANNASMNSNQHTYWAF